MGQIAAGLLVLPQEMTHTVLIHLHPDHAPAVEGCPLPPATPALSPDASQSCGHIWPFASNKSPGDNPQPQHSGYIAIQHSHNCDGGKCWGLRLSLVQGLSYGHLHLSQAQGDKDKAQVSNMPRTSQKTKP